MKDIKDYLHLYLGCELIGTYSGNGGAKGYLTGVTNGGSECEIQFIIEDGINVEEEPQWNDSKDIKLILRHISDMTQEERKELWRLIFSFGNEFNELALNYRGQTMFIDKTSYYERPRWLMQQGVERLGIEMDGTIWADCDLHHWRYNQHEVTKWLLSKGFDLFGLIDARLAIKKESYQVNAQTK
ncbi:MAG TPA: hypothetical protein VL728_19695 [Cyclobacteriaceae bacterium]|jgi:hypothetical protein|nr:hypothetical protein [Cyclobacteriaceae bacterium]